jgi:hypothetical protein
MWKAGTIMTLKQKYATMQTVNSYVNVLKKTPISAEKLIEMSIINSAVDVKVWQHLVEVTHPKISYPIDVVQKWLPNIIINPNSKKVRINNDQMLSAVNAYRIKDQPFFTKGKMFSLANRDPCNTLVTTVQQRLNTGQSEPDFYYFNPYTNIWYRYYDWKSGHIKPNAGNIFATSDQNEYEDVCRQLLRSQYLIYKDNSILGATIKRLYADTTLNWGERSDAFKLYLMDNMYRLPHNITPSLVFKTSLIANADSAKTLKYLEGFINLDSLVDLTESQKTLARIIASRGSTVINNYALSEGQSPTILQLLQEICQTS